jgi:serine protease inhibitor
VSLFTNVISLQLGIRDLFSNSAANLHGVARERSLYVSKIIQKAGLEVNENGTTAFASTGKYRSSKNVHLIRFLTAVKPRYSATLN